jgi:hypothetical protein
MKFISKSYEEVGISDVPRTRERLGSARSASARRYLNIHHRWDKLKQIELPVRLRPEP